MSAIRIYVRWELSNLKKAFTDTRGSITRPRTWWTVYLVYIIYNLAQFYLTRDMGRLWDVTIVFGGLLFITAWMRYMSGRHVAWDRQNMIKRARKKIQEEKSNGTKEA